MKTQTKAELRDRIAELEGDLQLMTKNRNDYRESCNRITQLKREELSLAHKRNEQLKANNKRTTLAAYALLATLFVIVGAEVVW